MQKPKPGRKLKKGPKRDSETESEDDDDKSQLSAGEEPDEDASDPDQGGSESQNEGVGRSKLKAISRKLWQQEVRDRIF